MARNISDTKPAQTRVADKAPRTIAGVRLSAIIEVALFIGVTLLIDRVFFDGSRFRSASQHPFWIPVLLVAAQYGTNAGLLAAIASSAALLAGNLPAETIAQDRFTWWFAIGKLPLMWFLSALVFGELRVRQMRERAATEEQLTETSRRERMISDAYKQVSGVKEALETRLASQMKTAVGLYESVRAIEQLNTSEVLIGIAALVRSVVNPEKFSAYLLQNGRLELAVREGWSEEDDGVQRPYGPESALFVEIVSRQRVLSVANADDASALAGAGVVAVPIVTPDGGRVVGMLKIEKLGFLDLTFSNLQTLKVMGEWIGAAYDNAERYQTVRAESVVNTQTELLAYGFFSRQLSFLGILAARIGFDLTMVIVRLQNGDDLPLDQRAAAPRAFGRAAATALRKTDLAFDYQRTGAEFALILPASTVSHAEVVVRKLKASLAAETATEAPDAQFTFAIHAIHEATNDGHAVPQDLLEMAKAVEQNREEQHHA
jgi:hypothetical protein